MLLVKKTCKCVIVTMEVVMNCKHELKEVKVLNENGIEFYDDNEGKDKKVNISFSVSLGKKKVESKGTKRGKFVNAMYCTKCNKVFAEYEII